MKIDVEIDGVVSQTIRARQLAAAFDVPMAERQHLEWAGELPIEDREWQVGLIVGPSGAGKTTITRELFGIPDEHTWNGDAVVDDFPETMSIEEIAAVCQAVGFNTIPAWLRRHDVLSTGERFRVELARRLVESSTDAPIVIDEFTSVVDRQVAKIGADAAQKWVRRNGRQLVAVTCHADVEPWLRPDWVLEPATMTFRSECLQRRPPVECAIERVDYAEWARFAPFHYLTAELNRAARCFVLYAGDNLEPAAFAGVLHRVAPKRSRALPLKGLSRLVTLPDWQGLGLAFALADRVAAAYVSRGYNFHSYPAHPALIRSFDRSPKWELREKPGQVVGLSTRGRHFQIPAGWKQGSRPNAVFRFRGEPLDEHDAAVLLGDRS